MPLGEDQQRQNALLNSGSEQHCRFTVTVLVGLIEQVSSSSYGLCCCTAVPNLHTEKDSATNSKFRIPWSISDIALEL